MSERQKDKKTKIQKDKNTKRQKESNTNKHQQLFHSGEEFHFSFEAEKFFKDAMSHQIFEGVCINNSPSTPGYLMNSRAEYEQGAVARLNVVHGL